MAKRRYGKRKKEQNMGRVLLFLGSLLKIIQIIGAAFSVAFLTGSVMTVATTCLLVGGLCVFAVERMNLSAAFAMVAVVGLLGGLIPAGKPFHSFAFMAVCLIGFAGILLTRKKPLGVFFGIADALLLVLLALQFFGVVSLMAPVLTVILVLTYAVFALGLFI